jgi:hypothetical protein
VTHFAEGRVDEGADEGADEKGKASVENGGRVDKEEGKS